MEIVEACFVVVHIAAVAEGIEGKGGEGAGVAGFDRLCEVAPSVIRITDEKITTCVQNAFDVAAVAVEIVVDSVDGRIYVAEAEAKQGGTVIEEVYILQRRAASLFNADQVATVVQIAVGIPFTTFSTRSPSPL